MTNLEMIRKSLEDWYNSRTPHKDKKSIVINYSDEQHLAVKGYHRTSIEICVVGISNNLSYSAQLYKATSHYNHGNTIAEEAKDSLIQSTLTDLFHLLYQGSLIGSAGNQGTGTAPVNQARH